MTGVGANDTLWSNNQGMGLVDLGRAFDGGAAHAASTRPSVFGATGQTYVVAGSDRARRRRRSASGSSGPTRPGPTTGNAWVNNLDLQVNVNGTTYSGNVFTGRELDRRAAPPTPRNNAEFVFLPGRERRARSR